MRRKDREITDQNRIREILDSAKILHLGIHDDPCPYVVPLHYGYGFVDGQPVFYMHSAKEGHKLDLIRQNPHVCVQIDCGMELISGGDNACRYGASYASVIGRGRAEILDDPKSKAAALTVLMRHQTGRDFEIQEKATAAVSVIRVILSEYSAKERPEAL
ncbi:MAG: pyridoxamine 5'-phosphate oxidase family protein [Oscillospiraceae bacterium]|nr:pyridoxamine 5'-phosphate oxidase family protein [Oscillospiraceae bacterium]